MYFVQRIWWICYCIYRYQEMSGISIYESFICLSRVLQDYWLCGASVLLVSNYTYTIPILWDVLQGYLFVVLWFWILKIDCSENLDGFVIVYIDIKKWVGYQYMSHSFLCLTYYILVVMYFDSLILDFKMDCSENLKLLYWVFNIYIRESIHTRKKKFWMSFVNHRSMIVIK